MMNEKVYDAFRSMGISEENARSAAVAIAETEPRLQKLESDIQIVKWMLGTNVAISLALLFKAFT
jgi:hypothetical protein